MDINDLSPEQQAALRETGAFKALAATIAQSKAHATVAATGARLNRAVTARYAARIAYEQRAAPLERECAEAQAAHDTATAALAALESS